MLIIYLKFIVFRIHAYCSKHMEYIYCIALTYFILLLNKVLVREITDVICSDHAVIIAIHLFHKFLY